MRLFCTGITVDYKKDGWVASCHWLSGYFAEDGRVEGTIKNYYIEDSLSEAIDYVLETMNHIGVEMCKENDMKFALYTIDEKQYPQPILQLIRDEAVRRGWEYYFD
jgi:hypothetical protein